MKPTINTSILIQRPVERHCFALAKVPIRIWQTQFWTKEVVEAQTSPCGETQGVTSPAKKQMRFHEDGAFAHQLAAA